MRTIDEVIKDCEIIARNKKATAEEHKQFMRWLCKMAEKESGIEGMIKKIKQLFCRHRWRAVEIHRWRAVGIRDI